MNEMQRPSVIEKIQDAAQKYGIKALAAELNKAPSTVYSELNPWGDRSKAKLGLEDALEIMRLTGDFSGLASMAAELGFMIVERKPEPDKDTLEKEKADDIRSVADFHEAIATGADEAVILIMAGRVCDEAGQTAEMALRVSQARNSGETQ